MKAKTVFISYSHDSVDHSNRVLEFANALRTHGIDAEIDRYQVRPLKGWPRWCEEKLRPDNSDFVLMVCTPTYLQRVQGRIAADEGRGVLWEGRIIYGYIYESEENHRFIPILFSGSTPDCIPIPLRDHARYEITAFDLTDCGYENLYRELTGQPFVTKPPLGDTVQLPKYSALQVAAPLSEREVQPAFPFISPSRLFEHSICPDKLVGRENEMAQLSSAWTRREKKLIIIFAWAGVGKTSLVARWAAEQLARDDRGGIERYFDWSFYSQGTPRAGRHEDASAEVFLNKALAFFGDPILAESNASARRKGAGLAQIAGQHRSLIILDGIEPLQDPKTGELGDEGILALLRSLAEHSVGLCVVTTRRRLPELADWKIMAIHEQELAHLTDDDGADLLSTFGVGGDDAERRRLSRHVKGHALTLTLLGSYLKSAHRGDIHRVDRVNFQEVDERKQGGHAFRVIAAYERWFVENNCRAEIAILRMLGLFDRPATSNCLKALRNAAIVDLTDTIVSLSETEWKDAVAHLVELNLVEERSSTAQQVRGYSKEQAEQVWSAPARGNTHPLGASELFTAGTPNDSSSLDAHPLIREFFAHRVPAKSAKAWIKGHTHLFKVLKESVPYWPEGNEGLQPLYQAVAHGCLANMHQLAFKEVYWKRIHREHEGYAHRQLGLFKQDLQALAWFFDKPWFKLNSELSPEDGALVLGTVGSRLRALGQIREAIKPTRLALKGYEGQPCNMHWAAHEARHLSEIALVLGCLRAAIRRAENGVTLANAAMQICQRSPDSTTRKSSSECAYQQYVECAVLGTAWHHFGDFHRAQAAFAEAKSILSTQDHLGMNNLYSLWGFRHGDFLLDNNQLADATELAEEMMRFREAEKPERDEEKGLGLIGEALERLLFAKTHFLVAQKQTESVDRIQEVGRNVSKALEELRHAERKDFVPLGLFLQAEFYRSTAANSATDKRWQQAEDCLEEALSIAKSGKMRLHEADCHLGFAELFSEKFKVDCKVETRTAARARLQQAAVLIIPMHYGRRYSKLTQLAQELDVAVEVSN